MIKYAHLQNSWFISNDIFKDAASPTLVLLYMWNDTFIPIVQGQMFAFLKANGRMGAWRGGGGREMVEYLLLRPLVHRTLVMIYNLC